MKKPKIYDIIFLDDMMPGLSGTETLKEMKTRYSSNEYKASIEMIDDDVNNIDISGTNVFDEMIDETNMDFSHLEDKE